VATEELIAVFIDFENLALGVRDDKSMDDDVHIGLVLNRLLEKGRIVYKRAYCDWSRYRKATQTLHKHGVTMVDIPQTGMSGKNSADIHMVVDAMDLCYSKDHISAFALLTGDSDFSPLVNKLKENEKQVIGCGVKNSTSGLLVKSCDLFIYYDDLIRRDASKRSRPARKTSGAADAKRDDAVDQVMEVVRSLAHDYENVWSSMVKQTLGRVNPGFNFEHHGYKSFNSLIGELEKRGLVELDPDRQRGNIMLHIKEQ
jgi:uncharacterized protein (TIGR00288 family)